jgi:hypothetical protein
VVALGVGLALYSLVFDRSRREVSTPPPARATAPAGVPAGAAPGVPPAGSSVSPRGLALSYQVKLLPENAEGARLEWTARLSGESEVLGRVADVRYRLDPPMPNGAEFSPQTGAEGGFALTGRTSGGSVTFTLTAVVHYADGVVETLGQEISVIE